MSHALLTMVAIALPALPARATDSGIYTIVDGDVRVLRGATWFRLVPGARLLEGDVVEVGDDLVDRGRGGAGKRILVSGCALGRSVCCISFR